jgi:putative DNA primase/helicase
MTFELTPAQIKEYGIRDIPPVEMTEDTLKKMEAFRVLHPELSAPCPPNQFLINVTGNLPESRADVLSDEYFDQLEAQELAEGRPMLQNGDKATAVDKAKYRSEVATFFKNEIDKPRPARHYRLWNPISVDEEQELRAEGLTPENNPTDFAPFEIRFLTEESYARFNSDVAAYWAKYGQSPRWVQVHFGAACSLPKECECYQLSCALRNWNDAAPTYFELLNKSVAQGNSTELVAVRADSIKSKAIKWLWNFRVPMNKLSVLAGNPDQGKSLISLYMTAQLTRGLPMYGDARATQVGEVLLLAGEDDAADTLVPRLEAAGANMKKVHILTSVMQKSATKVSEERDVELDRDIQVVENFLKTHPYVRMIVIDPISSFLGRVNMNREQEVRGILTPLKNLAERRQVAIVAVMHLNKVGDQSAIHRIGGAVAFTGVARSVWLFVQDEADKNKHMMLRVKNNIAKASGGLLFTIDTKAVRIEGEMVTQPIVNWIGETEDSAADVLLMKPSGRPDVKIKTATEWLDNFLTNGAQSSADIQSFGKKAGHAWGTLQRSKDELGVQVFQQDRKWYWQLSKKGIKVEQPTLTVNFDHK